MEETGPYISCEGESKHGQCRMRPCVNGRPVYEAGRHHSWEMPVTEVSQEMCLHARLIGRSQEEQGALEKMRLGWYPPSNQPASQWAQRGNLSPHTLICLFLCSPALLLLFPSWVLR